MRDIQREKERERDREGGSVSKERGHRSRNDKLFTRESERVLQGKR